MKIPNINWKQFEKRINKAMGTSTPIKIVSYKYYENRELKVSNISYVVDYHVEAQPLDVIYIKHLNMDFNVGLVCERIRVALEHLN